MLGSCAELGESSLILAEVSTVSAWIAQRHDERKDLMARTIAHREQLYSDFISESARAMADGLQHTLEDPSRVTTVYALISRENFILFTPMLPKLPRIAKKLRVLLAWTMDLFFGREIEQMITLRDVEVLTDQIMRIRRVNGLVSKAK